MPVKPTKNASLKPTGVAKKTVASRREAVVATGLRRRGFTPYWLEFMAENDIDFLEAYERIYELTAVRKSVLPAKFREMIVVAAVAIGGYQSGLKQHVHRALQLGATKHELIEVFQSAYFHTGALTLVHGMIALIDCLKELEEEGAIAKKATATKATATKATATKATATKTAVTKAVEKKATAKKTTATQATATKTSMKKSVAKKAQSLEDLVKKPAAKRATKRATT